MGRRSDIDWEKIHKLYIAGQLTIAEICEECGVHQSAITRRAKKEGWIRNLSDAIRQSAKAKIAQIDVCALVEQSASESAEQSAKTIKQAIEEAANSQTAVVLRHRGYIKSDFEIAQSLRAAMYEMLSADDLELSDVVKATTAHKSLVELTSKLIDKERQAYGIDESNAMAEQRDMNFRIKFEPANA